MLKNNIFAAFCLCKKHIWDSWSFNFNFKTWANFHPAVYLGWPRWRSCYSQYFNPRANAACTEDLFPTECLGITFLVGSKDTVGNSCCSNCGGTRGGLCVNCPILLTPESLKNKEDLVLPVLEQTLPCSLWQRHQWTRLSSRSSWRFTVEKISSCSPWRTHWNRRMPEGDCDPMESPHSSRFAGSPCDPMEHPHCSTLFLKDPWLWKGPTLEQFMKDCSLWEGPMLEKVMDDCLAWE